MCVLVSDNRVTLYCYNYFFIRVTTIMQFPSNMHVEMSN